jgi:predicted regulator of Ras-like GTPase activity (Roadblock/LC7/MglB family)
MSINIVLPAQLLDEYERHLNRLYDKTGATCVLLIDISGQLISYKGTLQGVDLVNLAALVAGDMAAVAEMAKLIGEKDRFKLLFHEGDTFNIIVSAVRGSFLLAIVFKTVVQIGLVRLFTRETVTKLLKLSEQREEESGAVSQLVDADFTTSLADELERTFNG